MVITRDRLDKEDLDTIHGKHTELASKLFSDIPNDKWVLVKTKATEDVVHNIWIIPIEYFKGVTSSEGAKNIANQLTTVAQRKGIEVNDYTVGLGFVEMDGKFKDSPYTVKGHTYVTTRYEDDVFTNFRGVETDVIVVEFTTYTEDIMHYDVLRYDR